MKQANHFQHLNKSEALNKNQWEEKCKTTFYKYLIYHHSGSQSPPANPCAMPDWKQMKNKTK